MLGLVEKLIDPVAGVLDKVIEDKDQKAKLAHEIATMSEKLAAENAALQAKANLEAAKHPSLFVAGARPAILWCCCLGLFLQFFVMPIADWVVAVWYPDIVLFELDIVAAAEVHSYLVLLLQYKLGYTSCSFDLIIKINGLLYLPIFFVAIGLNPHNCNHFNDCQFFS